jgi:hypothetical protein
VVEGSGWLAVTVPPGTHTVTLQLERTTVRAVTEGLSVLALLVTAVLAMANRRRRWVRLAGICIGLLIGAVALARFLPVAETEGPVTMDFTRTAYPHYNPEGVSFGESRLTGAGLTEGVVEAGQGLFVNLTWENPWAGHQLEAALVSPAEHMPLDPGGLAPPDVRVRAEQNQGDAEQLVLDIPGDVPTGMYFVRLRVFDGEDEIPPRSAEGHELGTVYLGPVRLRGKGTFRETPTEPVARMGDLRLHAVQYVQDRDRLEVRLFWETDRELAVNYVTSVRLIDPDEEMISQNDKQPLYGFYPTSAWPVGEQILDKRSLTIPEGTPPGDRYMLQVLVYEAHSGDVLGAGRVSEVRID